MALAFLGVAVYGEASVDVGYWVEVVGAGSVVGALEDPGLDSAEDSVAAAAVVVEAPPLAGEAVGALAADSVGAATPAPAGQVGPPSVGTSAPVCPLSPCVGP